MENLTSLMSAIRETERVCGLKPLAPAVFIGMQECPDHDPLPLFSLTEAIPGHPLASTVSEPTLRQLGYAIPSYKKEGHP